MRKRKAVINDDLITPEYLDEIVLMVLNKIENPFDISKKDIVKLLINTRLSSQTIARVIDAIIPDSQTTQSTVRSLIRFIREQDNLTENLLNEIRSELYGKPIENDMQSSETKATSKV